MIVCTCVAYRANVHKEASMRVLPDRVRELRQRRMLTQAELAEEAGITESTINRIEQGHAQAPRISTIRKIAKVLDVPAEDLISWNVNSDETLMGKAAA